jgi:amino-acid N-acetyltransferase
MPARRIRKARTTDIREVQKLVNSFAKKNKMIPRSLSDLYERIRDISVYPDEKGRVRGACALHVVWADLAEIRSLAVDTRFQGNGIGTKLVKGAIKEARELGIRKVFVLTYVPEYFRGFGFKDIDKAGLPHKIWADCINCPNFPECDEVALILELKG